MIHQHFRNTVKWLGILLAAHLAVMLVYVIGFSGMFKTMLVNAPHNAINLMRIFSVVSQTVFILFYVKFSMSYGDYRRRLRTAMKESAFSIKGFYKTEHLSDDLWKLGAYAGMQLITILLCAGMGLWAFPFTGIGRFFIMDTFGFFLWGNAILGAITNIILFGGLFFSLRILLLRHEAKTLREM